jgi:hypothetical protein
MKNGETITVKDLGGIRPEDTIEAKLVELRNTYEGQEEKNFKWAVFNTFKMDFVISCAIEFIDHSTNLFNPIIIDWLMQFFTEKDSSDAYGFKLLALMVIFKNLGSFFGQHSWGYRMIMNQQIVGSMKAMVFEKQQRMSPATNKQFDTARVNQLIDKTNEWYGIGWGAQYAFVAPFLVVYALVYLFYILRFSFIPAFIIIGLQHQFHRLMR